VATINLNDYLPVGKDGTKEFLPKQEEFYSCMLNTKTTAPKFGAYVGGIGSGKSVIGCITLRDMAIREAGDYLVCRQFMPELKMTTYKTFLEFMPPELILEHRIADAHLKIKAVNGISNIYFRPLEEPDKMRSLNLNAFLIDEANQVSEEAFLLLQGRLRGKAWRKGMIVSNPNGHDFIYRLFYKKDMFKTEWAKNQYKLIRAPSTENIHLPEGYIQSLMESWSEDRVKREIEGSFDAFEGAVYSEFRRDMHVIKPFVIPSNWVKFVGIDHGYRNPSAWIWCAVGPDGEVYAYREYYKPEMLIHEIVNGTKSERGVMHMMRGEVINRAYIDPSTKARRGTTGESDWDEYYRVLPRDFPLYTAINDVQVGIDRVKSYLKPHPKTNKPLLYIFDTCTNLIEEMTQYRYQELKPSQEGRKAEYEKPVKANDHALDALRYVIVTLPEPVKTIEDPLSKMKYNSVERALYQELQALKRPKPQNPFG
jgi:PBSX family phage terminase large subunit